MIPTIGSNVRVYVEQRMDTDSVHVHLYTSDSSGTFYWRYTGDAWQADKIESGSRWPEQASLVVPSMFAKALIDALTDYAPPDKAQAKHLADTLEVRDRMLLMFERQQQHLYPLP